MNYNDLPPEVRQATDLFLSAMAAWVLNAARSWFNSHTELNNLAKGISAAREAVQAVEQLKANGDVKPGEAKSTALDIAAHLAPQADPAKLDPLIEAAHFAKDNAPVSVVKSLEVRD